MFNKDFLFASVQIPGRTSRSRSVLTPLMCIGHTDAIQTQTACGASETVGIHFSGQVTMRPEGNDIDPVALGQREWFDSGPHRLPRLLRREIGVYRQVE